MKRQSSFVALMVQSLVLVHILFYNTIFANILAYAGDTNYYDIRKKDEGCLYYYDFSNMEEFLNKKSVRHALGVGEMDCHVAPQCIRPCWWIG